MIEATIQIGDGFTELIPCEFHELPKTGDIVKIAAKQLGPIVIEQTGVVQSVVHLICPASGERKNLHLINIVLK